MHGVSTIVSARSRRVGSVRAASTPGTLHPKPSSSGSVPKLKQSILSPPRRALPLASASSSILCKGPQGIKPFRRPTQKGDSPFGRRNFTFRPGNSGSPGRRASIFSPIINIAAPANSFSAPWKP